MARATTKRKPHTPAKAEKQTDHVWLLAAALLVFVAVLLGFYWSGTVVPAFTPDMLAAALAAATNKAPDSSPSLLDDAAALTERGLAAAAAGEHARAAALLADALEVEPHNDVALRGIQSALDALHGRPQPPSFERNHSDSFRVAIERAVADGSATRLSSEPPIFVLHDLLNPAEAQALLRVREERARRWRAQTPIVCFDHGRFQRHPKLPMRHGIGADGRRSCLSHNASRVAATLTRHSESIALYAGEEALADAIGERLRQRAGLHTESAINFQLLTYRDGSTCKRRALACRAVP